MSRSEDLPLGVLEQAKALGFLGPGPVEVQRRHATGFGEVIETHGGEPRSLVDLGSGGGLPGLVLAARWPACRVTLIESNHRRCEHLRRAIATQGWEGRVTVVEERAERAAHDRALRERFPVATARGLAEPAVVAEIAAGFVTVRGMLVVSEPPEPVPARWPPAGLAALGFGPALRTVTEVGSFVVIRKERTAPESVPRGTGRPAKRPRW